SGLDWENDPRKKVGPSKTFGSFSILIASSPSFRQGYSIVDCLPLPCRRASYLQPADVRRLHRRHSPIMRQPMSHRYGYGCGYRYEPFSKNVGGRRLPIPGEMKKQDGHSGGRSWSLGASAKMKSNSTHYNPAEIKLVLLICFGYLFMSSSTAEKQREFYKNAKHIKKYKKLKQKTDHEYSQMRIEPIDLVQEEINTTSRKKQRKKSNLQTLREEYEKKKQEEEKAKMEAEAIQEAKKREKEKVMAQKKELKHKMLKRTRSGQPIMKYRLDHLIENLQRDSN
ncbi:hypothetical protein EJ110_NYTH52145, partial [Nymphaea thermarum]